MARSVGSATIKGIPAGMYEVRRCKSYENNPTGVWVLNID